MPTNTDSIRATHMSLCATGFREKLERLASMMSLKPALPMFLASCKTAKLEVIRNMQLYCVQQERKLRAEVLARYGEMSRGQRLCTTCYC